MTTIDAGTNPDLANSLVTGALSSESSAPVAELPRIQPPPERSATLLVGLRNVLEGTTERDVQVRELTGADEEALTSPTLAKSTGKYLAALVERGTESIGGAKPSRDDLGSLLIGDRELLLLAIRKATYGEKLELLTRCPHCEAVDDDFTYDLNQVQVKDVDNMDEALYGFDLVLPSGKTAHVNLPTASVQDALLENENKSTGEVNTLMLARTVQLLDGVPVHGPGAVKALSIRDRNAILKELGARTPGPQIGEAKRTCGACDKEFGLNLGLLDLFRS